MKLRYNKSMNGDRVTRCAAYPARYRRRYTHGEGRLACRR